MRAVFLDRDGVINRKAPRGEYITSEQELELLPGVADAIASLRRAGFLVIVVTNQRGIARGKLTFERLAAVHARMQSLLTDAGAALTAIYVCPHQEGCGCRKPAPGLLLRAAEDYDIVLNASWMVGDCESDIAAGCAAGCLTLRISDAADGADRSTLQARSLIEAADLILAHK